jgi:hypothetical protein
MFEGISSEVSGVEGGVIIFLFLHREQAVIEITIQEPQTKSVSPSRGAPIVKGVLITSTRDCMNDDAKDGTPHIFRSRCPKNVHYTRISRACLENAPSATPVLRLQYNVNMHTFHS